MFFKKKIKNTEGSCYDCQHAKTSSVGSDVVCNYYGIVSSSGICKKYKKIDSCAQLSHRSLSAFLINPISYHRI